MYTNFQHEMKICHDSDLRISSMWHNSTATEVAKWHSIYVCMYIFCFQEKFSNTKYCFDNDTDWKIGLKFYNSVLNPYSPILWSYIVSFIQASSHMFVPQLPPFITGVTHWEALSVFLFRYIHAKFYICI